jgi:hypothetical protein
LTSSQRITGRKAVLRLAVVSLALIVASCNRTSDEARKRITPEYDKATGKLQLLKYDSNGDGKIDTWSYMDGARVVRIEIDKDEDGKIDRWEYYGPDQKIEKIGFSRANDGKEDAWSYPGPDGTITRIEISTKRDGKVERTEHYEKGALVSAEEASVSTIDKWETYDGDHLATVAFDTQHRGTPDRRLVYGRNGQVTVEVDPKGDGRWALAPESRTSKPQSASPQPRAPRPE